MVVITILMILAAVGIGAFRDSGQSTAVSSAAVTVTSAVSAARQLAISKNCRTRFFVVTDARGEPDWKLRRYGVLRVPEDTTDVDLDGNVAFELASRMDDLPPGVYFRENRNYTNSPGSGGPSMFDSTDTADIGRTRIEYAYIEFLPSGGTSRSSNSNIFELERAPSADEDIPDNKNFIGIGVAQSTGRVKFDRPDLR